MDSAIWIVEIRFAGSLNTPDAAPNDTLSGETLYDMLNRHHLTKAPG